MNYILTHGGITLVLKGRPVVLSRSHEMFEAVTAAIREGCDEDRISDMLESQARKLEQAAKLTETLELLGGQVRFKGQPLPEALNTRMLQMIEEGFSLSPMEQFLLNLENNPSKRVHDHLYAFLEAGQIPLTDDGHFLAYKAVRDDYSDIHTGAFDNSVGATVSMPRHLVDEDPDKTCSDGLHVCSFAYLPYFAHNNGHVMVCKVNPADVVAIPRDYNNTKMRLCRYTVIGEYEGYYDEFPQDALADSSVAEAIGEGIFELRVTTADRPLTPERFRKLADAASAFEEAHADGASHIELVNVETGAQIQAWDADDDDNEDVDEEGDFWSQNVTAVEVRITETSAPKSQPASESAGAPYSVWMLEMPKRDGEEPVPLSKDIPNLREALNRALNFSLDVGEVVVTDAAGQVVRRISC